MSFPTWLAFAGASIVLLMIPGPTILLVIGDSLANHQRSSWSTVAGVAAGDTTAMSLSLAGAGALLAASAAAFALLKLAGGAYLIYLGLRALLRAHRQGAVPLALQPRPAKQRFASAWAVTALNPKSLVFFIAFVPQFISPRAGYVAQCAILLPTFVLLAAVNAAGFAHIGRYAAQRLTSAAAQRRLGYGGGLALLGAGVLTLGMSRR